MVSGTVALMRFLYLGNVQPVHICSYRDPTYETVCEQLAIIREMVEISPGYPFNIIQRVIDDPLLVRNTECIIAIAYCVRCVDSEPLRTIAYAKADELLRTDLDLFRFVHWASLFKKNAINKNTNLPETVGRHGFGRGMKRCIAKWYLTRTAEQLMDMLSRQRGHFAWNHVDLMSLVHVQFEPNDERWHLINAMHRRGVKILRQMDDPYSAVEPTASKEQLERILRFRVCESVDVAVKTFLTHRLEYEHVPSHLLVDVAFWTGVLNGGGGDGGSALKYVDFLRVFVTLHDRAAFDTCQATKRLMLSHLSDVQAVSGSGVQPLHLLSMRNAYATGVRHSERVKANWYLKMHNAIKDRVLPGRAELAHFSTAINAAYDNVPDMGDTELLVTVDLRAGAKRRKVFNMEHLNCFEAMVCLALGLVKKGRTKLFAFTPDLDVVKLLKLAATDSYEQALQKCEDALVDRTKQSLGTSIRYALGNHPRIFITIMDSAARIVRQGLPEFAQFEKHRESHPNSRYIVINLGRHTHDLHSYPGTGVLEICGLRPDVLTLCLGFIHHKFH